MPSALGTIDDVGSLFGIRVVGDTELEREGVLHLRRAAWRACCSRPIKWSPSFLGLLGMVD